MKNKVFIALTVLLVGCTHPMPEDSFSIRCWPEFRNWPRKENGDGFVPFPALHLIGISTNTVTYESVPELYSVLNTNECYDFTVAKYERTLELPNNRSYKIRGLKVIKIEHSGRSIYRDFKDLTEND